MLLDEFAYQCHAVCHGSITSMPVLSKSLTLRVASVASVGATDRCDLGIEPVDRRAGEFTAANDGRVLECGRRVEGQHLRREAENTSSAAALS